MPLDTFISGRYTNTYNAVDVGITDQGIELQQESGAENIEESDAYGTTLIDWVYRGGRVSLQFMSKAYKAGSTTPFWPWSALGRLGVIGRLASDVASATVLTATTGTPAAAAPATLTAGKSILAPNNPATLLFNSKLRQVPVRLACLAYDQGAGAIGWFVTT